MGTRWLGRIIPLLLLGGGLVMFFALDLDAYFNFETLHEHREVLHDWVGRQGIFAILAFMVIYALAVACSIPGGAILTIVAGFLFGTVTGSVCAILAATVGATIVFAAVRYALGDFVRRRAGKRIQRMETGFRENAFNYLLVLRLIPVFPFWLVNVAPAATSVPIGTYVLATFLGIIPGTVVYASVGNGLDAVFAAGTTPDLQIIFEPQILVPIIALAVLAFLPVIYKRFKANGD